MVFGFIKRPVLTLAALACLGAGSWAQIRKQGSAYVFRAKYVQGSTIVYDMKTIVEPLGANAGAGKQTLTLPILMRILEVRKPAGKNAFKIAKIRSEAGPIKLNGKLFKEKAVETVQVDELNRLQSDAADNLPQFTTPLPEKPLKVGQSWSSVIDPSGAVPFSMKVTASYRLKSINRTFATVQLTLNGQGTGSSKITTRGQGTMLLRVRDGTLESMKMVQTVVTGQAVGAKTTISVTRRV